MLVVGTIALWSAGAIMLCAVDEARNEGLISIVVAAMTTSLLFVRSWLFRMGRAFAHGYHAGWHDASARVSQGESECYPEDCDVMDLAEVRARRY